MSTHTHIYLHVQKYIPTHTSKQTKINLRDINIFPYTHTEISVHIPPPPPRKYKPRI